MICSSNPQDEAQMKVYELALVNIQRFLQLVTDFGMVIKITTSGLCWH